MWGCLHAISSSTVVCESLRWAVEDRPGVVMFDYHWMLVSYNNCLLTGSYNCCGRCLCNYVVSIWIPESCVRVRWEGGWIKAEATNEATAMPT